MPRTISERQQSLARSPPSVSRETSEECFAPGGLRPPQRLGLAELDELHGRLKAAFEARRLTIPRLPDLLRELAAFEYAIMDRGNLTLHGDRDDHVDSLALAARPLTRLRSEPGPPGLLRVRRDMGWWGP